MNQNDNRSQGEMSDDQNVNNYEEDYQEDLNQLNLSD